MVTSGQILEIFLKAKHMVFPDGLDIGCERVESRMTPGLGLTKLMDGVGIH